MLGYETLNIFPFGKAENKPPKELVDFSEIPKGHIAVEMIVSTDRVSSIAREGLSNTYNTMAQKLPKQEQIMEDLRINNDPKKPSRTKCLYAYLPMNNDYQRPFGSSKESTTLEVAIDPTTSWVERMQAYLLICLRG